MKTFTTASVAALISTSLLVASPAFAKERMSGRAHEEAPTVFVTSQGLYYDSIALGDLPQKGDFQQLIPGMNGLATEFGPGQVGHLGGRWWIDRNMDGEMNAGDKFFLCPLLGPGRETM